MKAFSYLRVSGKGQIEGDGFPRQRDAIEVFGKKNGIEIVREFRDEGISGETNWHDRPGFSEMVSEILSNGVRTVVIENMTRLARAYVIADGALVYLASKGIALYSADTGENVTEAVAADPMKKALIQMQAVFSELEKSMIVAKLRKARARKKAETGKCEGRKAFGEREGESATMDLIRTLRRKPKGGKRMAIAAIAEKLNQDGIPSRTGKPWHPEVIRRLLGGER